MSKGKIILIDYLDFDYPDSIGLIRDFWGNILVLIRALVYILSYGNRINEVAENSVLNANYLKLRLKDYFIDVYKGFCCHEFVLSASNYKSKGIRAFDIAKRLLDYNVHPPTVYFPLIVEECLMIEPTETESLESLENFINAIENFLFDKTAIIIAHRISTILFVDKIIVMENGRILDIGKHEELIDRCEVYRNLVEIQAIT